MKKVSLLFGSIAGIIVTLMMIISFSIAPWMNSDATIGFATMIIAFSTIFFGIRHYRDTDLNGEISFKSALKLGLIITLVASTLYVISWMIISQTLAKDFMINYSKQSIEHVQAGNLSDKEKAAEIQSIKDFEELYKNPMIKIAFTYLEIFPVGLLISLLSAFLLKRKLE